MGKDQTNIIHEKLQNFSLELAPPLCDTLRDLVAFVQFKKREKHPWKCVNVSSFKLQPATLLKVTLLHGRFSHFLNCATATKPRNALHTNVAMC